jgi:hypothetical protein
VKRLAPILALLWWAQGPLCLLGADASHAHAPSERAAAHADHHADHGAPAAPLDPGTDEPSCAEHCASLAQAVPAGAVFAPPSPAALSFATPEAAILPSLARARRTVHALDLPPPEPPFRTTILRI